MTLTIQQLRSMCAQLNHPTLDADTREGLLLSWALDVHECAARLTPPRWPARPGLLRTVDDRALAARLASGDGADTALRQAFASWRSAVWCAEQRRAVLLCRLLRAIALLSRHAATRPQAEDLRALLIRRWEITAPEDCDPLRTEIRRWIDEAARPPESVAPGWLLAGDRPPRRRALPLSADSDDSPHPAEVE